MPSLRELPRERLETARDAADTVISFRGYLPGNLLVMILGRWRGDIGDIIAGERPKLPRRDRIPRTVDQLTTSELARLSGAVAVLLAAEFTATMDDPELPRLLGSFQGELTAQKTEREGIEASIAS